MESCVMAKPVIKHEQVKILADVVKSARIVCAYRGGTLASYMSELLAPLVARDLAHEQAKAVKPKSSEPTGHKPLPGQVSLLPAAKGKGSGK